MTKQGIGYRPGPFDCALIRDLAGLEAAKDELAGLADRSGAYTFSHPAFFLPWARAAAAERQQPDCLALRRDGRLVGFVPFFVRRDRKALMAARLMTPRVGSSPPFAILIDPEVDPADVIDTAATLVAAQPWCDQSFIGEPEDTVISTLWAGWFAARGYAVTRLPQAGYFTLEGCRTPDDFLAAMKRRRRNDAKRMERRLAETGCLRRESGAEAAGRMHDAIAIVVAASWKNSKTMTEGGLRLLQSLAQSLAEAGRLNLWVAELAGRPVGVYMEILDPDGTRHAFFIAQEQSEAARNVGNVMLFRSLMDGFERGLGDCQFWGSREYIRHVANGARPVADVTIANRGVRATAALAALAALNTFRGPSRPAARAVPKETDEDLETME